MTLARPILNAAEMRAAEQTALDAGASVEALMERAGAAVAEAAWRTSGPAEILILCGPGNNGGDGYVAARRLQERGVTVRVAASAASASEAARQAAARWQGPVEPLHEAKRAPVVIDALFGTGLSRPLDDAVGEPFGRLCAGAQRRIAVDLPSGVATDDGAVLGSVPVFDLTVALGALKPAHRLLPSAGLCGQIAVADIGLGTIENVGMHEVARPALTPPGHGANKYSRGKLVILAGAMAGAGRLAALAGQRAGAGYVELLSAADDAPPHSLVRRAWSEKALHDERIGAIVIGPGLGLNRTARDRLEAALASGKPLLLDADALTLIGKMRHERLAGHVLTPHWGEFVRLFGDSERDRLSQARAAAIASGAVVLLKGADSIVACPDGRVAIAPLAPTWLASAGTGDVLAGIIGGLLAGGRGGFEAAQDGLWLHAEAARLAGPMLVADDLITCLPRAVEACL
ncbi:NAD(P)H-hydrate dehydratase [Sphingomonas crusticola]|uniref:NAD(P)H-hydrate dehydratase n=1 Tax=Sphingomonas crusticola TaxID=1697973 RepID=UPI000E25DE9B|nr:NAD(P)H-hydrate dehydratase [Sphingomonas crusticola]